MARFRRGEPVTFRSTKSHRRFEAKVHDPRIREGKIAIVVATDPYPVLVNVFQLSRKDESMATKAPSARALANEAKMLGVKGYRSMTGPQLKAAVEKAKKAKAGSSPRKARATSKPAKRTPAKRTTAKKATSKRRSPSQATGNRPGRKAPTGRARAAAKKVPARSKVVAGHPDNPFRPGSNLFFMAEELLKGGIKTDMVKRLKKRMHLNPWSKDEEEDPDRAINKRLMMTASDMVRTFKFKMETDGRGLAASVRVYKPVRKSAGQSAKKKANSRTATGRRKR
jgi:hypothetical protein